VVSQCGMVVPPQDSAALGAAICNLADDPRARLDMGRCARAYAESNFEREAILRRIFGQLDADVQRVADDAIA
jgi:colanic acid biosynthesis glycosyl transferase WcaI